MARYAYAFLSAPVKVTQAGEDPFNCFKHQAMERKAMAANVKACGMVTDLKQGADIRIRQS